MYREKVGLREYVGERRVKEHVGMREREREEGRTEKREGKKK